MTTEKLLQVNEKDAETILDLIEISERALDLLDGPRDDDERMTVGCTAYQRLVDSLTVLNVLPEPSTGYGSPGYARAAAALKHLTEPFIPGLGRHVPGMTTMQELRGLTDTQVAETVIQRHEDHRRFAVHGKAAEMREQLDRFNISAGPSVPISKPDILAAMQRMLAEIKDIKPPGLSDEEWNIVQNMRKHKVGDFTLTGFTAPAREGMSFSSPLFGHFPITVQPPSAVVKISTDTGSGHYLWMDGDLNIPSAICDSNGQVVLAWCKICGQAEGELASVCPGPRAVSLELSLYRPDFLASCDCHGGGTRCWHSANGVPNCEIDDDGADDISFSLSAEYEAKLDALPDSPVPAKRADGNGRDVDADMEADGDHDQGAQ